MPRVGVLCAMGTAPKPFGYVYLVTNKITGKCYVGQTVKTVAQRWVYHVSMAGKSRYPFGQSIAKHGADAFEVREIDVALSREDLNAKEIHWIALHDTKVPKGYNLSPGGGGNSGLALSPEARAKISAANKGKVPSPAARAKMSYAARNRPPEVSAKMSASHKGLKATPETRAKMSASQKNRPPASPETRAKLAAAKLGKAYSKGYRHTPEAKAKLSAQHKDKSVSPETRAKLSVALSGRKASPETRAKMVAAQKARREQERKP